MIKAVAQHLVRNAPNVPKGTISRLCVKTMVLMINETKPRSRPKKGKKGKSSMKLMNQKTMVCDDVSRPSSVSFLP